MSFVFAYNRLNLPQTVSKGSDVLAYGYSANGSKREKRYNNASTQYYCGNIVYNNSGAPEYVLTPEGMVRNENGTWKRQYNLTDHLGNTRAVLAPNATVLQQTDYCPFGAAFSVANTSKNKYFYGGKELQGEKLGGVSLGLYDFEARYYNPMGIFTTRDPLDEKDYGTNPYAYCGNNPVNRVDPTGMDWYQNNETKYYTWYGGNEAREGYTYIGEKGSVLGEFEPIIDDLLTNVYGKGSMFNEGFTFDITPNDKGALIGSKERDSNLLDEFAFNMGPEISVFLSDHPYTEEMKTDKRVVESHQSIFNGKTDVPGQITNVGRSWGVWDALTTRLVPITKQFIGSYRFGAFTSQDGKYLNNVISDTKNLNSLVLHLTPNSWNKGRNDRNEFGNTYQFYIWKSRKP